MRRYVEEEPKAAEPTGDEQPFSAQGEEVHSLARQAVLMAKRRPPSPDAPVPAADYDGLLRDVVSLLEMARHTAARAVNAVMTATWESAGGSWRWSSGVVARQSTAMR